MGGLPATNITLPASASPCFCTFTATPHSRFWVVPAVVRTPLPSFLSRTCSRAPPSLPPPFAMRYLPLRRFYCLLSPGITTTTYDYAVCCIPTPANPVCMPACLSRRTCYAGTTFIPGLPSTHHGFALLRSDLPLLQPHAAGIARAAHVVLARFRTWLCSARTHTPPPFTGLPCYYHACPPPPLPPTCVATPTGMARHAAHRRGRWDYIATTAPAAAVRYHGAHCHCCIRACAGVVNVDNGNDGVVASQWRAAARPNAFVRAFTVPLRYAPPPSASRLPYNSRSLPRLSLTLSAHHSRTFCARLPHGGHCRHRHALSVRGAWRSWTSCTRRLDLPRRYLLAVARSLPHVCR